MLFLPLLLKPLHIYILYICSVIMTLIQITSPYRGREYMTEVNLNGMETLTSPT